MIYNTFSMRDLFANPEMQDVFPQFAGKLQNVYSFAAVEKRIKSYLKNAFSARESSDGGLIVRGKHMDVLKKVTAMKTTLENLFNNTPAIVKNIRSNSKVYLPYTTTLQVANLKTPAQKIRALNYVLENINYNPDFRSMNRIKAPTPFEIRQKRWEKKVGYKA